MGDHRRRMTPQERRMVWCSVFGVCAYCGRPTLGRGEWRRRFTVDHAVPLVRGGAHEPANWRCACWVCNNLKAAMTEAEFREVPEAVRRRLGRSLAALVERNGGDLGWYNRPKSWRLQAIRTVWAAVGLPAVTHGRGA